MLKQEMRNLLLFKITPFKILSTNYLQLTWEIHFKVDTNL